MATNPIPDHPTMSPGDEVRPTRPAVGRTWIHRVGATAVAGLASLVLIVHVLELLGEVRPGPTVILVGAATAAAWAATARRWTAAPVRELRTVGGLLAIAVVAAPVAIGWFATGIPLVDGDEAAHLAVATEATRRLEFDAPLDFTDDPVFVVAAPGLAIEDGTWTVDDQRLWTGVVLTASWLGPEAAFRTGALLAAVLALVTTALAARWMSLPAAALAGLFVAVSPVVWTAARGLSPSLLAAVLGVGAWWLTLEALDDGTAGGAVVAGVVAGTCFAVSPLGAGLGVGTLLPLMVARPRTGEAGYLTVERYRHVLTGFGGGVIFPVAFGLVEAGRAGRMLELIAAAATPALVAAAAAGAFAVGAARWGRSTWLRAGAAAVFAVALVALAVFALGPRTETGVVGDGADAAVAAAQIREGVPVEPARTYEEASLVRLRWWAGSPALILGVAGIGWMALAAARAEGSRRTGVFAVMAGITGATAIWRPGAEALMPPAVWPFAAAVIPSLGVGIGYVIDRWFEDAGRYLLQTAALLAGAVVLVVPLVRLASLWDAEVQGEAFVGVTELCGLTEPDTAVAVVLRDGALDAAGLAATVRAWCGVPAAALGQEASVTALDRFVTSAFEAQRTPFVLSDRPLPFGVDGPELFGTDTVELVVRSLVPTVEGPPTEVATTTHLLWFGLAG